MAPFRSLPARAPTGTPGTGGAVDAADRNLRTLVFDHDVHARAFFEALRVREHGPGPPENVELLFRAASGSDGPRFRPPRRLQTKIDRYCNLVTINVFYRNSR